MLEQFHFILGWIKKNKIMTIVYLSVLVLIITSNMLLTQFFVNECKTDEVGKYYYAFYFNETIDKTKIKRMCTELEEELDVEDLMLVTHDLEMAGRFPTRYRFTKEGLLIKED